MASAKEWKMPNHVTNEIIFRGVDAATQERILAQLCNADGDVDFNILVPAPLNMWWGNVGQEHEKTFKRTRLDWARENWGTKWNTYDHRLMVRTDDTLTLCFDTAWSPPYPWLAAVFNFFNLSFEYNYLNEGEDWSRHGIFDHSQIERGDPWQEKRASDEIQKHLHVIKWGCETFPEEEAEEPAL